MEDPGDGSTMESKQPRSSAVRIDPQTLGNRILRCFLIAGWTAVGVWFGWTLGCEAAPDGGLFINWNIWLTFGSLGFVAGVAFDWVLGLEDGLRGGLETGAEGVIGAITEILGGIFH